MAGPALALLLAGVLRAPAPIRLDYDVTAGEGARDLAVDMGPDVPATLAFDDAMGEYVHDATVRCGKGEWQPVEVAADRLDAPSCAAGRRVRYRFALRDAAREHHDRSTAFAHGEALLAPPSTFLARPLPPVDGRFRLRLRTPPGLAFVTGLSRAGGGDTYEADLADLPESPYSAFADVAPARIRVGGGEIDLAILRGPMGVTAEALRRWAEEAGRDVAGYYGRLPVPRVLVIVVPGGRRAVGYGTTLGNGGASILVWVGERAREEDLARDWVLTHEMVHLALPNLPRGNAWLEEGIATYVEPIARARRGRLSPAAVWSDLVRRTPSAVPGPSGLAGARGFGAMYWGGALFCLLADVEIRQRTDDRRSLDDALRGVQTEGGSIVTRWSVGKTLAAADAAVQLDVPSALYARMAHAAAAVDLPSLWARLGVVAGGGEVAFDDAAPLAAIRRAITREPAPRGGAGGGSQYAPASRPRPEVTPR